MRSLQRLSKNKGLSMLALVMLAAFMIAPVAMAAEAPKVPAKAAAIEEAKAVASAAVVVAPELEASRLDGLPKIWWIAPIAAGLALIFAIVFYKQVKAANPGDKKMIEIAKHVTDGAMAYLARQYKVVAIFFAVVAAILFVMGWVFNVQHKIVFVAFLTGGFFSGLCGWIGMKTATLASNRTTQGAKEGLNRGLQVAFRAGAVMGLIVVGFGLLDICGWFIGLRMFSDMSLVDITVVMLTFGMGASSQALFARVGGGIYTKAADVGADLVGKVEAGIPEDDPRNPATIADNVGDNVGDVAGMGADLYESYCGSILATAALGVSGAVALGLSTGDQMKMLAAPMVIAGVGILLSIIGIFLVRCKEGASMRQLMNSLNMGVFGSSVLIAIASFFICRELLGDIAGISATGIWGGIVVGMVAGIVIGKATEVYTSYDFRPTQEVAENADTGAATVIISGIAEGMKSTWMSLLTVMVAIILAYVFAGGGSEPLLGLYGVGIAAVGMLSTLGITLATDAYGPIADNAGGNAEMTGQDPEVRERTDALDSLGNTTAAVGKGFAIGSAALTALALLAAYVEEVRIGQVLEAKTGMPAIVEVVEANQLVQFGNNGKFAMSVKGEDGKHEAVAHMALSAKYIDEKGNSTGEVDFDDVAADTSLVMVEAEDTIKENGIVKMREVTLVIENEQGIAQKAVITMVPSHVASLRQFMDYYGVNLMNPKVLCGIFAGVLLVFLFSAMTMKAVGRAAMAMVMEVRRQFKEIPGILEGTGQPDYARCVDISTKGAQKEMVAPALLALAVPIAVGLVLDVPGVLGLLAGGLACGFAVAIFMANAGGAWDNAKKYIETGAHGGKGSDAHKAAVVGDTVGDPFKDTSGPSLNILIKLMSMVSVVFAGLIVKFAPMISQWIGLD